jgi:pimeloyl-ACP methyl ester carboxylesterase
MDDLASLVLYIIDREQIPRITLVGHSMGGYITIAFAELYRERLRGYCLFHSTCFADSDEKKINRDREISLVKCGKKKQIINVNIPKGFANDNHIRLKEQIERAKEIARSSDDDGVIALLKGMKQRPDRSHVMVMKDIPILLIGGKKDNYIPVEVFFRLTEMAPHASSLLLENSGHMGFIEEPEQTFQTISSWINP